VKASATQRLRAPSRTTVRALCEFNSSNKAVESGAGRAPRSTAEAESESARRTSAGIHPILRYW